MAEQAKHTAGRLFYSSALPRFRGDEVVPCAHYCIVWRTTADPDSPAIHCETPDRATVAEAYDDARAAIAKAEGRE
jgi:hypothetical protein